jgi:hypothetical protein
MIESGFPTPTGWRWTAEDRPPVVDALGVPRLELLALLLGEVSGDEEAEQISVEVGRLTQEVGLGRRVAAATTSVGVSPLGAWPRSPGPR